MFVEFIGFVELMPAWVALSAPINPGHQLNKPYKLYKPNKLNKHFDIAFR